jgi:hypothetical protein
VTLRELHATRSATGGTTTGCITVSPVQSGSAGTADGCRQVIHSRVVILASAQGILRGTGPHALLPQLRRAVFAVSRAKAGRTDR